ncbi:MAG: hypothetical protein Q8K58_11815 [Acidimicrobiales bacterium]|nr:hypothetical protein [Acidimicrobiales bacterium]
MACASSPTAVIVAPRRQLGEQVALEGATSCSTVSAGVSNTWSRPPPVRNILDFPCGLGADLATLTADHRSTLRC